jgi:Adenosine deaminase
MEATASAWDWLLARALLNWRERVLEGRVRLTIDDARSMRFPDHLRELYPEQALRVSDTDLEGALAELLQRSPDVAQWYTLLLAAGDIGIEWSQGQPWIEPRSLERWTILSNDFEADATLTLDWARRSPAGTLASDRAALGRWRTVPRSGDNELRALARRGLADMHIHVGGVRIFQQTWIELMIQRIPASRLRAMVTHYRSDALSLSEEINAARNSRKALASEIGIDLGAEAANIGRPNGTFWFSWSPGNLAWERMLLIAAWRRLRQKPGSDNSEKIRLALDAYLYRKNRFYRWASQPVLTDPQGLRAFERRFSRLKRQPVRMLREPEKAMRGSLRKGARMPGRSSTAFAASPHMAMAPTGDACRYLLESEHLQRMELRIGPLPRAPDYWRLFSLFERLKTSLQSPYPERAVEIRFAVHFKRTGDPKVSGRDHEPDVFRRLKELDRDSAALRAARADPEEMTRLRALARIDVAGQERDTPIGVYAFHLRLLRGDPVALDTLEAAAHAQAQGKGQYPLISRWLSLHERGAHRPGGWEEPLGLTVHAGEDYADILDGIYQVASAIESCGLMSGDTLGHGLALGDTFEESRPELSRMAPRGAAFDSQCWLFDFLDREHSGGGLLQERRLLERLIQDDGEFLFGSEISITKLLKLWKTSRAMSFPSGDTELRVQPALADPEKDRRHYLAREALTDTARRFGLRDAVLLAQRSLLEAVGRRGIVIEINPSSNARVSGVKKLVQNPSLALLRASEKSIRVSINTDDPGVFVGVIENEYAMLLHAAQSEGSGLNERMARDLLEAARYTGLNILR